MAENTELTSNTGVASATNGFTFVEDDDTASFYVILPDGEETDWSEDTEIAVFDDGELTYAATNCDDYPGMRPGVVYAIGGSGSVMPTTIENYADLPDEEEEDEDEGDEADSTANDPDEEEELEAEDPDAE
jgi:hypothetical protein